MNGPIDIAVDRSLIPPPLPDLFVLSDLLAAPPPPQLIGGLLHQGCKMILGGISKTNKSWCLLDLAISVASGQPWWGRPCVATPVVYLNFELPPWAIVQRLQALLRARPECAPAAGHLRLWNLRGFNADLTTLRPRLEQGLASYQFGFLIADPVYKLLGDRNENANGEIADLMNEFEALSDRTGAAICIGHHFAKGNALFKSPIDRLSGAGTWARDPDALLLLTPHEEPNCYTVTTVLRHLPELPDFVVQWDYPLMRLVSSLDAGALQRRAGRHKICTDREFLERVLGNETQTFTGIIRAAKERLHMGRSSAASYLQRLLSCGAIAVSGGLRPPKSGQNHLLLILTGAERENK